MSRVVREKVEELMRKGHSLEEAIQMVLDPDPLPVEDERAA